MSEKLMATQADIRGSSRDICLLLANHAPEFYLPHPIADAVGRRGGLILPISSFGTLQPVDYGLATLPDALHAPRPRACLGGERVSSATQTPCTHHDPELASVVNVAVAASRLRSTRITNSSGGANADVPDSSLVLVSEFLQLWRWAKARRW